MEICGCKGCDSPVLALGMCNKHWRRTKLYGSPFVVMSRTSLLRGKPLEERFARQIRKTNACWEWTGALDSYGYGRISGLYLGVKFKSAHRLSWSLHNGALIPDGMHVCHSCDNPKCVNPAHLWLGTSEENHEDKVQKGRHRTVRGVDHPDAVLRESQVVEILRSAKPHIELAREYGVAVSTISSIKTRKSWAHLDVDHIAKAPRVSHRKGKSDRINEEIVREIRNSTTSGTELAERYGVSRQLITNIRKRRCWTHVD